jgi:hypothetical protein
MAVARAVFTKFYLLIILFCPVNDFELGGVRSIEITIKIPAIYTFYLSCGIFFS